MLLPVLMYGIFMAMSLLEAETTGTSAFKSFPRLEPVTCISAVHTALDSLVQCSTEGHVCPKKYMCHLPIQFTVGNRHTDRWADRQAYGWQDNGEVIPVSECLQ